MTPPNLSLRRRQRGGRPGESAGGPCRGTGLPTLSAGDRPPRRQCDVRTAAYTIYVKARGRFASFLQMGCGHPLSPLQAVCEQPVSVAILGQASAQTILSSFCTEPILI